VAAGRWLERLHHRWLDAPLPPVLWWHRHLFSHKLKWQRRSVQSDVLSVDEIQAVLTDLEANESWHYPLFLLWLSTGLGNAEIRGLTWDCIRWEEGEVLVCKSLRRDGFSSGQHSWASTTPMGWCLLPRPATAMSMTACWVVCGIAACSVVD
jgi:integrase